MHPFLSFLIISSLVSPYLIVSYLILSYYFFDLNHFTYMHLYPPLLYFTIHHTSLSSVLQLEGKASSPPPRHSPRGVVRTGHCPLPCLFRAFSVTGSTAHKSLCTSKHTAATTPTACPLLRCPPPPHTAVSLAVDVPVRTVPRSATQRWILVLAAGGGVIRTCSLTCPPQLSAVATPVSGRTHR
jgi:hypothetical protein